MANFKLADTVEHVRRDFQLSPGDAGLYVHLLVAGPARVSELAESLHLHRNDVYRAAERLGTRGLVRTALERPTRFVADPPEVIFEMEIQARTAAVEALRSAREKTTRLLADLQSTLQPTADASIRVVQGRQEIAGAVDQLISGAKTSIHMMSTVPTQSMLLDLLGTTDVALERAKAGVDLRLLLAPTPENLRWAEAFKSHPNAQVRSLDTTSAVRFVLVDGQQICLTVVNDKSTSLYASDEVAIVSLAPGLVQAEQAFFTQSWDSAA